METPVQCINTLYEWLSANVADHIGEYYQKIYDASTIPTVKPTVIGGEVGNAFKASLSSPAAFVGVLPNGRVWGPYAAILTPDNLVVAEFSHDPHHYLDIKSHPIFKEPALSEPIYYDETIAVIASVFNGNYYHWFFDVLARIHLIERSRIPIDRYLILDQSHAFQKATLSMMGIPNEKIMTTAPNFHIQAKRLILPSYDQPVGHTSPWACRFFRHTFKTYVGRSRQSFRGYQRIYISRSGAAYRRVTNERLLLPILQRAGFKIVRPETYTLQDQIALFAQAEAVIGPTGAALTNLVFCRPGTKVAIFQPAGLNDISYWAICNMLQLRCYLLLGRTTPLSEVEAVMNLASFEVHPPHLQQLLNIIST
jgi:capsular polysaccharide biosynthesis protein